MAQLTDRPAYSYRDDPAVPEFDDSGPVVVMDGNCMLCSQGARIISRLDRKQAFRICPIQTPLGGALLAHYGLEPDDPESWLFLDEGKAKGSLQAIIGIGRKLGGIGWALAPLGILPRAVQDWLYRRIAYNRYRLFGHSDMCAMPDPALKARLIG
ncbi:thiol-disulfide oxidoreductase DCC family protein [Amaricoccus macauensis]|uniref:thiol-disulfide oxidoreductase DCC family protein n=1 Tax=Amaricoccus macauensis TaxID=57001 RepID=UPI003C7EAD30